MRATPSSRRPTSRRPSRSTRAPSAWAPLRTLSSRPASTTGALLRCCCCSVSPLTHVARRRSCTRSAACYQQLGNHEAVVRDSTAVLEHDVSEHSRVVEGGSCNAPHCARSPWPPTRRAASQPEGPASPRPRPGGAGAVSLQACVLVHPWRHGSHLSPVQVPHGAGRHPRRAGCAPHQRHRQQGTAPHRPGG